MYGNSTDIKEYLIETMKLTSPENNKYLKEACQDRNMGVAFANLVLSSHR